MKKVLILIVYSLISLNIFANDLSIQFIINRLNNHYHSIDDYQCRIHEWCKKGKRFEKRIMNFYFKKPRLIRIEILRGNKPFDKGMRGLYIGGDKIIGYQKGLVLEMSKYHTLATTVRGVPFDESDLQAVIDKIDYYLENGKIICDHVKKKIYRFTCFPDNPAQNAHLNKEVIYIDVTKWLPVLCESYEGDQLVQHVEWKKFIINAGLPKKFFKKIRFHANNLAKNGINSIHEYPILDY